MVIKKTIRWSLIFFITLSFFSSRVSAQLSTPSIPSAGVSVPGVGGVSVGGGGVSVGVGNIDFFGGKISSTLFCTCSGGTYLEIEDYTTGNTIKTMYLPGISTLQEYYNLTPGAYTIGGFYNLSMDCEVEVYEVCVTIATADSIIDSPRGIGTSK